MKEKYEEKSVNLIFLAKKLQKGQNSDFSVHRSQKVRKGQENPEIQSQILRKRAPLKSPQPHKIVFLAEWFIRRRGSYIRVS